MDITLDPELGVVDFSGTLEEFILLRSYIASDLMASMTNELESAMQAGELLKECPGSKTSSDT